MTGLLAVVVTCFGTPGQLVIFTLAFIHGVTEMLIYLFPIFLSLRMYSPIPKPLLAVMYIGIGGSLFLASLHYYKHIWETERKRVKDIAGVSN